MKIIKTIIVALAISAGAVHAQQQDFKSMPQHKKCTLLAGTYMHAIQQRNFGLPPANALYSSGDSVPLDLRKAVINHVYFDPRMQYAIADSDFMYAIIQRCINGEPKQYETLK